MVGRAQSWKGWGWELNPGSKLLEMAQGSKGGFHLCSPIRLSPSPREPGLPLPGNQASGWLSLLGGPEGSI